MAKRSKSSVAEPALFREGVFVATPFQFNLDPQVAERVEKMTREKMRELGPVQVRPIKQVRKTALRVDGANKKTI